MTYNPALGMMGNIKELFKERNKLSARTQNNEGDILQTIADDIEAVEDEYNALVEE